MSKYTNNEIIIGIVGGIKADIKSLKTEVELAFKQFDFEYHEIKITNIFELFKEPSKFLGQSDIEDFKSKFQECSYNGEKIEDLKAEDVYKRLNAKITLGNTLRTYFEDNALCAYLAITYINIHRAKKTNPNNVVYVIDQLKTKEEYIVFRKIYGRSFFLIGGYEDEISRMKKIETGDKDALIKRDYNEPLDHGQKVYKVFPESHF